jgi:sigma-E factor negative regulatory protein RseC
MDTEEGIILETYGRIVTVQIKSAGACSRCKAGCMERNGFMVAEAENPIGAKVGDTVSLGLDSKKALTASFVVFGLPLFALFIGVIATNFVIDRIGYQNQILSIIIGLIAFFLMFIPVKAYDKHLKKSGACSITIVEILNNS